LVPRLSARLRPVRGAEAGLVYSEIESGFEVREVEVYRDGRHDYALRSTGTAS
jgi:Domain of unknown function (DUF6881)